ncbi:MAG: hypothetical protein OXJ64_04325 [Boseongicola sp.]|nr:hypothetical protein [Boseongicola sp.]
MGRDANQNKQAEHQKRRCGGGQRSGAGSEKASARRNPTNCVHDGFCPNDGLNPTWVPIPPQDSHAFGFLIPFFFIQFEMFPGVVLKRFAMKFRIDLSESHEENPSPIGLVEPLGSDDPIDPILSTLMPSSCPQICTQDHPEGLGAARSTTRSQFITATWNSLWRIPDSRQASF